MNRKSLLRLAAGLVVLWLVLAVVGWGRYVVMHPLDRRQLAGLVVSSPPSGFSQKPASSDQVAAASNPFSSYKAIAKRSPGSTAAYSVSWTDPKATNDSATVLVSYLPSGAGAGKVQAQARSQFLTSGSFKAESYTYVGPVAVPEVPGAGGAVYKASGSATTPPVAAVAFSTGRAQVLELLGRTGTPANAGDTAAGLARSEYTHLLQVLPGFHLRRTSVPLVATIVYWAIALGVVVLAVSIPLGLRRGRRRRAEARQRTTRRQQQVRGSKIARRQARRR